MYCAINARQLQYRLTVTTGAGPGMDCVQVTFSPHLSALQEVFSLTDVQLSDIFMEISVLTDV